MIFKSKVKRAFKAVKNDLIKTRTALSNSIFSLSNEYTRLQLRIQELEKKVEELEGIKETAHEKSRSYAVSY